MPKTQLTREDVLAAAARLVVRHGPQTLTMRRLAAELDTAVTSIYWHVGNREALLDALVERTVREMGALSPRGRTPVDRVVSVARALRRELRARPHLIAMVHERGLTERMFLPAQQSLVREVHAAGLRGARAAQAVRAVQYQVVGHVLVERNRERSPVQSPDGSDLWSAGRSGGLRQDRGAEDDPALARALARPADPERLFALSVRALAGALLAGASAAKGTGPAGKRAARTADLAE
ncbi:TetR/AcrR family transcriptional regulator [Streptomyces sp. NPDC058657]|uniref:TetR/AcrR family transcriptional regulator n=1 Tax=unclassified Streptomyces TaxID=2593676 RepID=UPI00365D9FA5